MGRKKGQILRVWICWQKSHGREKVRWSKNPWDGILGFWLLWDFGGFWALGVVCREHIWRSSGVDYGKEIGCGLGLGFGEKEGFSWWRWWLSWWTKKTLIVMVNRDGNEGQVRMKLRNNLLKIHEIFKSKKEEFSYNKIQPLAVAIGLDMMKNKLNLLYVSK